MKIVSWFVCVLTLASLMMGCSTPSDHVNKVKLGMTGDDVRKVMGPPFDIRASKTYDTGETAEVWEYIAPVFSLSIFSDKYDKTYWIFFENGKVVQWGVPGDFSGADQYYDKQSIKDYYNKKLMR